MSMVEYASIGSLLTRKRIKAKSIKDKAQVYAVTNSDGFVLSSTLHDFNIFSEDTSNYLVVERNDFAYNPSRLNIGSISYFKEKGKGLVSPMYVVFHADESKVLPSYLFIVIRSESVRNKIESLKEVGARFRFDFKRWDLIQIPIPSLSEQFRIVGILDTFTSAIDNLKLQISQRKKQFEYYRDQLLDLEGKPGVEMKTLGEIGDFIRGSGIQKTDFVEDGYGCIHYGQIHTKYGLSATKTISKVNENLYRKSKKAKKGDVVLATTSEDAEGVAKPVVWLGDEEIAISGDAYIYHHNQNGKYIAHLFASHRFFLFKIMNATGTKVVRISGDKMEKFIFPLPSIKEQNRIVSILDQFEFSISNLESQLVLRQKQYEYYRNKLLTFE